MRRASGSRSVRGTPRGRNTVRIIGGVWRRRLIHFPDLADLRPTPDRVRETVFNWLGQDLSGLACLDLFAGSGALGFEAASRGASSVVLVESHAEAHAALLENARVLQAANVHVLKVDAIEFLAQEGAAFDVIFLDPPFRRDIDATLLRQLSVRLAEGGLVYLERDHVFAGASGWHIHRHARAGNVHYHLLKRQRETQ